MVLVVEDNPVNQQVIGAMLHQLGADVILADNGQKAVDQVLMEAERISVILMDVQMPVMDGYEATRQIRHWEALQGRQALPIIAVTADAFAEDQTRCREAGMDDFLAKPIKLSALGDLLHRYDTKPVRAQSQPVSAL